MDLVVVSEITLSLLTAGAGIFAFACGRSGARAVRAARRERLARMLESPPESCRTPAQRLDVAERLLRHAEMSLAECPGEEEEREALLFGLRWADTALADAELLAMEERARLAAARRRLCTLRSEAEDLPAASTRRRR